MDSVYYQANDNGNPVQHQQHFPLHDPSAYGAGSVLPDNGLGLDQSGHDSSTSRAEDNAVKEKKKRASKACNACRKRKVKCDSSTMPCKQCAEHDIPCLFTLPARKRGPPNAYVEAQRAKLIQYGSFQVPSSSFGSSVDKSGPDLGLEELAPPEVLNLLFNDFFECVYPTCPIIVESLFRRTLSNPAAYNDDFMALCASILAYTVACMQSSREAYESVSVDGWQAFALLRLGIGYRDRMSVNLLATLQYLALSSAFDAKLPPAEDVRAAMFRAELVAGLHYMMDTSLRRRSLTFQDEQLLKRLHTYVCCTELSLRVQGMQPLMQNPATPQMFLKEHNEPNSLVPLDIPDHELEQLNLAGGVSPNFQQPSDVTARSYTPGIVAKHALYTIFTVGAAPGETEFDHMCSTIASMQTYLEKCPSQLRPVVSHDMVEVGFLVQKFELIVVELYLTSILLDQCQPSERREVTLIVPTTGIARTLAPEKQRLEIVRDLLGVLKSVARRTVVSSGYATLERIRRVAFPLLQHVQLASPTDNTQEHKDLQAYATILASVDGSYAQALQVLVPENLTDGYRPRMKPDTTSPPSL